MALPISKNQFVQGDDGQRGGMLYDMLEHIAGKVETIQSDECANHDEITKIKSTLGWVIKIGVGFPSLVGFIIAVITIWKFLGHS